MYLYHSPLLITLSERVRENKNIDLTENSLHDAARDLVARKATCNVSANSNASKSGDRRPHRESSSSSSSSFFLSQVFARAHERERASAVNASLHLTCMTRDSAVARRRREFTAVRCSTDRRFSSPFTAVPRSAIVHGDRLYEVKRHLPFFFPFLFSIRTRAYATYNKNCSIAVNGERVSTRCRTTKLFAHRVSAEFSDERREFGEIFDSCSNLRLSSRFSLEYFVIPSSC